jgi:hypothetical protein
VIEGLDYDPTRLLGNLLTMRFWIEISHFSENKEQKVLKSLILKFVAISSPDLQDSLGLEIARCSPSKNQTIDKDI